MYGSTAKSIVIYGAGDYGRRLYRLLQQFSITPDYFCQSEGEGKEEFFCGVKLINKQQLAALGIPVVVLIAISNEAVSKHIKNHLQTILPDHTPIFLCGGFISSNLPKDLDTALAEKNEAYCILCGKQVVEFMPFGVEEEIFSQHHIIGGGYRQNAICPHCKSIDRERWLYYVLKHFTSIFHKRCSVLHFAPEKRIEMLIRANDSCEYYTGDIVQGRAEHVVDVTDIQFKNEMFDYIIINHVLEHIPDEKRAISELIRVLKPEGEIILSFPVCMDQSTFEDPAVNTEQQRLRFYGQKDHVRLYGNDFKERIEAYGLNVEVKSPCVIQGAQQVAKYGLIEEDIIMVCRKSGRDNQ